MSQIFRLGSQGPNNSMDWQDSNAFPYNKTNRDTIQDPNGASASHEITSIPSPFARIDLVKNAFGIVANSDLDGTSIYHKMVSDALDVGELFFNIDKFRDDLEIITWDQSVNIQELEDSQYEGHKFLGKSLDTYLKRDKGYNFDKLQNIYLLNFTKGEDELNIIGATSPATFFFSNSNDISYVGDYITFGQDKPFDGDYQPLYKRDFEYVKAWFYLRNTIPEFANDYPEVYEYLKASYKKIADQSKKNILTNINSFAEEVSTLAITSTSEVEVNGNALLMKSTHYKEGSSDFEIASTVDVSSKPLVLPTEEGNKYSKLFYTTAEWGRTNKAPYYDPANLSDRVLPLDGTHYSYLTISDFLEDTIIKVPHDINSEKFFAGNYIDYDREKHISYLLPLKNTFFKYFTTKDLTDGLDSGKRMIEMENAGEGVKVVLRIPIKGNKNIDYIEYSRIYYGSGNKADQENNEGAITELDFTGYLTPDIKFTSEGEAVYKIGCIATNKQNISLNFFNGGNGIEAEHACRNENVEYIFKIESYTIEGHDFDYIVLNDGKGHENVIVPIFRTQNQTEEFTFAVDLGTSNTHIEYITGRNVEPRPLVYDNTDTQLVRMFTHKSELDTKEGKIVINELAEQEDTLEYDIMPKILGGESMFGFPTRTILSHKKGIDWTQKLRPLELINIPFPYNKKRDRDYNESEDDLKWGNTQNSNRIMRAYIECLALIMRNKVVQNGGELSSTKVTWFYPISMSPKRRNDMANAWNEMYTKYFGSGTTSSMSESIAPIKYFFRRYANARNLVNIDIGGGTTDIAYSVDGELKFVTSFRFASNDIFENGLATNPNNGIINYYKPKFQVILRDVADRDLEEILNKTHRPSNVASFLFTLPENPSTSTKDNASIDFNQMLAADKNFKVVFILFYSAIIYHIGKILLLKKYSMPRHITLSGNGSKVLRIITSNASQMANFTKTIFKLMGVKGSDGQLEILGLSKDSNPKQSTCKGALVSNTPTYDDSDKIVILKTCGDSFVDPKDDTFDTMDSNYIRKASKAVKEFFHFALKDLNSAFDFDQNFDVSIDSMRLARDITFKEQDIETFINRGLNICKNEAAGRSNIDETLFFYPIKGMLDQLSNDIYSNLSNK